jgi:hypothetical protein
MQGDITCLVTAPNPAQAHLWQSALEDEGIECKVVGDYLEASLGDMPGARPEVWVHRADAERAMAIIDAHTHTASTEEEES